MRRFGIGTRRDHGLTGVAWDETGACLARVRRGGARPRVEVLDRRAGDPEGVLPALAREAGGRDLPCTTVLGAAEYHLLPAEAPKVPREELRSAVRWQIRDLVALPVEDMAVDVFQAPPGRSGQADALYAVVASQSGVQDKVARLSRAGFAPRIVDIPEMAQRNLASLLPEDRNGVLMLSLDEADGLITVSRGGVLYFSRRLPVGRAGLAGPEGDGMMERVVLEVQRSLDYHDSHFDDPPVAAVVLAPLPETLHRLYDALVAGLAQPVRWFDPAESLDWRRPPPELSPLCLAVLGAALREEEVLP